MDQQTPQLTAKQQRFVAEYLIDLNATQAAIRAGYSAKTAAQQGDRLLRNAHVAVAVDRGQARIAKRLDITVERVAQEYARIAFADIRKVLRFDRSGVQVVDSDTLTDDQAAAIAEVSQTQHGVRVKLHDKVRALEALARHLGMLVEKHEIASPDGLTPLQIIIGEPRGPEAADA